MTKRKTKPDALRVVTLRLPQSDYDRLVRQAAEETIRLRKRVTVSDLVRALLSPAR